jgi:Na+/proline symporter
MYDLLAANALSHPIDGNKDGSYLTMRSKNGLIFGVINIIGNFATVFQDQAYWQRAIASRPASTVKAYLLGGLAWFAIPFTFATTLGLAAVALRGDPDMKDLSPADVSAGLPAAAAAAALLGKAGASAILVLLFLAVTSACSAELIAVSSVLTYDVYKTYVNPKATEEQILRVGHWAVLFYALVCALAGLIFFYINVSMGWLYVRFSSLSHFVQALIEGFYKILDVYGCYPWIGCLSDSARDHLEEGEQVGLYRRLHRWLHRRCRRLARHDRTAQSRHQRRHQRRCGETSFIFSFFWLNLSLPYR